MVVIDGFMTSLKLCIDKQTLKLKKLWLMFNVSLDAYRKYLFKRNGWPLKGPLGFSPEKGWFFYCQPWKRQKGHLHIVWRSNFRNAIHRQQAGRPPHRSQQMGQANQMSLANCPHSGTICSWCSGPWRAKGGWLGLGGGLVLSRALLSSRVLLSTRMAPGAFEVGWGSSSGGVEGTTWSPAAAAAAGGGGGGGGLDGILGFLVLPENVESSVVDIWTHLSSTLCSAMTITRYLIPEMTVKAWYNSSAMILAVIGFQITEWQIHESARIYALERGRKRKHPAWSYEFSWWTAKITILCFWDLSFFSIALSS
jgi:hypothetical protein